MAIFTSVRTNGLVGSSTPASQSLWTIALSMIAFPAHDSSTAEKRGLDDSSATIEHSSIYWFEIRHLLTINWQRMWARWQVMCWQCLHKVDDVDVWTAVRSLNGDTRQSILINFNWFWKFGRFPTLVNVYSLFLRKATIIRSMIGSVIIWVHVKFIIWCVT